MQSVVTTVSQPQSMSMEIDHGEIAEDYDSKKKELIGKCP